jgi:hypothetical protein
MTGPDSISSDYSPPLEMVEESPDSQPESTMLEIAITRPFVKGKGKSVDAEYPETELETELETGPETEPKTDWELELKKQQTLLKGTTAEEF